MVNTTIQTVLNQDQDHVQEIVNHIVTVDHDQDQIIAIPNVVEADLRVVDHANLDRDHQKQGLALTFKIYFAQTSITYKRYRK